MARKGDTPEYVNRMQQEVFEVLAGAWSREYLRKIESKARQIHRRYLDELDDADIIRGNMTSISLKYFNTSNHQNRFIRYTL